MPHRRRPRSVRKARHAAITTQERSFAKSPHSFVFSRPSTGKLVKQLGLDCRRVFEPYTASKLQISKKNVLKDFINIAGPLNVSHVIYFTHPRPEKVLAKRARHKANVESKSGNVGASISSSDDTSSVNAEQSKLTGGVFMHLIRTPNGPSVTFRVQEYSLVKDVFSLVRRVFDARQFSTPPLLAMTGFGSLNSNTSDKKQPPPPHLRLLVDMFQHMLPSLNLQKLKLSTVRRVLLLSREVDSVTLEDVIYMRHFNIRIENRAISKALRRLGVGGAPLRKNARSITPGGGLGPGGSGKSSGVPSLGKYSSIDEYLTKSNMLTDSGLSDLEENAEVELPGGPTAPEAVSISETAHKKSASVNRKQLISEAKASHGYTHLAACRKATIRLTEIGPRLTLKLIKIEEGVNSGCVLYHSWNVKSQLEVTKQTQLRSQKEMAKAARKELQEKRRQNNEAAKASHRETCIEGMRRTGTLPSETNTNEETELTKRIADEASESEKDDLPICNKPDVGRISRKKKKTKKPTISQKHPAYKYLKEKGKLNQFAKKRKHAKHSPWEK